jgi:hypothetical protein
MTLQVYSAFAFSQFQKAVDIQRLAFPNLPSHFIAFIISPGPPRFFTIQNSPFPIFSNRGLTKIRTYGLISRVRHGATVKSRIRAAASSAGAGGKLRWDGGQHSTVGLRCCAAGSVAPRQRRPTASSGRCGGSATKSKIENGRTAFLPHEPIPLNLHQIDGLYYFPRNEGFLWRVLSLFAANQPKCLSMNMLHTITTFFGQAQSRLIKPNQVIF